METVRLILLFVGGCARLSSESRDRAERQSARRAFDSTAAVHTNSISIRLPVITKLQNIISQLREKMPCVGDE